MITEWRTRAVLPHVNGKLLDLGCGINKLIKKYKNGIGVDVFQFGDADLIVKDTSKLPFENKNFDTITILAALNHIPNKAEVLKEVKRVLKDGGKLIITMIPPGIGKIWHKFNKNLWDRDQQIRGMAHEEDYGLTKKEISKILKSAGFKIIKEKRFMLFINRLTIAEKI